jgi:hypothetical protein
MTLEHIAQPAAFLTNIRRAIAANTVVFFQIPNGEAVLNDLAFWDIYYEHCSYFGRASLRYLFEMSGLRVLDLYVTYGDQYLVVEAAPSDAQSPIIPPDERAAAQNSLRHFRENISAQLGRWQQTIQQFHGERLVLWGGGSKAVALLNTLAIRDEVAYVIDINPQKHQTFLAGTGHAVMNPPHLEDAPPDVILLMNPMYRDEVQRMVAAQMGQCRIVTVQDEF